MKSIHFSFSSNWLKAGFVILAFLCVGITTSQAQNSTSVPATKFASTSVVNVSTAISRLEASVLFLKTSLNNMAPHTSAYNQALSNLEFQTLILDRLKNSRDLTNQAVVDALTFAAQVINTDRFASAPASVLSDLIEILEI